jgi:hypothetical protein
MTTCCAVKTESKKSGHLPKIARYGARDNLGGIYQSPLPFLPELLRDQNKDLGQLG